MVFKIMAVAALACAAGCSRGEGPSEPAPGDRGPADRLAAEFQEILGRVKLVKEEYGAAVRDGAIVDPKEYEEAEMFAEQAALRFRRVANDVRSRDAEATARIESGLAALMKTIADKQPTTEADARVAALLADLARVNPRPVPVAVEATQETVARADAHILAERQVDGYRIGLVALPPRAFFSRQSDGSLREARPDPVATHFVSVVLREPRTKRFLPAAKIRLRLGGAPEAELVHLWGDFPQYGANLALPSGDFAAEVEVDPPAYCRHGDMLASFTKATRATFPVHREGDRVVVKGDPPAPSADDYAIGDDVLQALGEARWKGEAGPYSLGFIAEAPEPIWLWENGKPVLKQAAGGETNHLEIALMEKGTMRIVPEAKVTVTLEPEGHAGSKLEFPLYPLMSQFYHYGNTVAVPAGRYQVTARIDPPRFGTLTPGVFDQPVEVRFPWDNRGDVADSQSPPAGGPS